jgi:hypothetical protein
LLRSLLMQPARLALDQAQENKILPDEYDSIESSLAPFRAYRKEDIKERHEVASRIRDTVLLTVKDGVGSVGVGHPSLIGIAT